MTIQAHRQEIVAALDFDANSGEFSWKKKPIEYFASYKNPVEREKSWNTQYASKRAGRTRKDGYREICVNGRFHYEHRIAFLYVHGYIPEMIDHINGNPLDNRIINLRGTNKYGNACNRKRDIRNKSGFKGVSKASRDLWSAKIKKAGINHDLGRFTNPISAARAYDNAALILHGGHAKTNEMMGLLDKEVPGDE